jgi:hypothetical protein
VNDSTPDTLFIPDKGHVSLVKPTSANDLSYLALKEFSIGALAHSTQPTEATISSEPIQTGNIASVRNRPPALFDIYQPEYEPYYLQRREDALISGYVSMQNVWVYGPSGYGKTAALTRALSRGSFRLVPLGHYIGSGPKGLFCGFYEALLLDRVTRKHVDDLNWAELISIIVESHTGLHPVPKTPS